MCSTTNPAANTCRVSTAQQTHANLSRGQNLIRLSAHPPTHIWICKAVLQKAFYSKVPSGLVLFPAEPRPTAVTAGWSNWAVPPTHAHLGVRNESSQYSSFPVSQVRPEHYQATQVGEKGWWCWVEQELFQLWQSHRGARRGPFPLFF